MRENLPGCDNYIIKPWFCLNLMAFFPDCKDKSVMTTR